MSALVLGQRHTCLKPTESGKNWNPQAQALQEFHSRWRLNLVPACFSKETGKTSQEMLGRPRKDDWFQDTHNGCSILWAPVAWISKHFLDFNYNSCKILKKKKKDGSIKVLLWCYPKKQKGDFRCSGVEQIQGVLDTTPVWSCTSCVAPDKLLVLSEPVSAFVKWVVVTVST